MKKRIISIVLAVAATASMLAVGVNAAEPVTPGKAWVIQTYEDDSNTFLAANGGDVVVNKVTEGDNTYAEVTAASDLTFYRLGIGDAISEDFVVIADLCKMASPSQSWQFQVYTAATNQIRWGYKAADMELGTWYTYLAVRKDGAIKHYRKVKDSDAPFEEITAENSSQISSGSNGFIVLFRGISGAEPGGSYTSTKFLADNIALYNGTFPVANSQKIEVTDTEGGKKISASVDVYTDANPDEEMTVAPVMVVFDKRGKIMDWRSSTVTVGAAKNTVTNEITMTDDYYEKVKGGIAELYLWKTETSFKPMMNGYRVTLD